MFSWSIFFISGPAGQAKRGVAEVGVDSILWAASGRLQHYASTVGPEKASSRLSSDFAGMARKPVELNAFRTSVFLRTLWASVAPHLRAAFPFLNSHVE